MAPEETKEKTSGIERHAVTILTLVIVALILWVGNAVQQAQVLLGQVQVELQYIKVSIQSDRGKFAKIEDRLDNIERELRSLKDSGDRAERRDKERQ